MNPPSPAEEIREIKHKLAAACGNDIHRIMEEARRHQRESGRKSVMVPLPQTSPGDVTLGAIQPDGEACRP